MIRTVYLATLAILVAAVAADDVNFDVFFRVYDTPSYEECHASPILEEKVKNGECIQYLGATLEILNMFTCVFYSPYCHA